MHSFKHCVAMKFPIKFDMVKSGLSIVQSDGTQVINKKKFFLSLKIEMSSKQ